MKDIIKQVAIKNGISEADVEKEIRGLIQYCINSPDPRVKARFNQLKRNGRDITPQELIDPLCLRLFSKMKH